MLDRSTRIKNLAIALEALYRTPATTATYEVERAIENEIKQFKEESAPKATNTATTSTIDDDNIPF